MAILKKPYEISVWEDILVDEDTIEGKVIPSHYQENRIMVIGSDEMTSPNKAFSPVLIENMNGEVTFTFSMAYKYFDPASNAEVINPFIGYLINERKIKLHYDNKWYDLIIVDHQEDSETMIWQYTAKDAFVNELSKNGYGIEFSTELGNNQGTAVQLAKETLKNTDWTVDEENSDTLVQKVNEPMVRAEVETAFSADIVGELAEGEERTVTIEANEEIYVFYSYIANKEVKYVQFLRKNDENTFTFDDSNNIIGRNYRITSDVSYTIVDEKITSFDVLSGGACQILYEDDSAQYTTNQGYRIVYGPLTTYDPVMERTVDRYQASFQDGTAQEVYKYTDSDYTTSNVVTSYVTNGSNFNVLEDGSLQGWSNATSTNKTDESGKKVYQHISLTTYPELDTGTKLIQLTDLTRIQGFLELKFDGVLDSSFNYTYFNSGFEDNAGFIDHISGEQEFVFRIACAKANEKHGDLIPLDNPGVRAMVAYYKEDESSSSILKRTNYRYIENKEDIILNFDGSGEKGEWVLDNPTITGGTFSVDSTTGETDYKNYVINNVVQEPTTNSVYKVEGDSTDYVWDSKTSKYVQKTDTNFVNYYRTIARARKPVANTTMTDPTVKIGIFLYTTDGALCEPDVYTYISDVQITKCVYDKNENPITIGNIPTTTVTETSTYYLKPKDGTVKEKVDVYYTLEGLQSVIGASSIEPIYNDNSEKILSINEAQSNCFNILQTICETFECWLDIEVTHDAIGAVEPGTKRILLKEFAGKDNFAGFKYGINLKSIQRTLNSEEIVTKLIVDNVQSDYVDEGVMSIRNATANPSGEANIINFDYYINKGLIKNGEDCRKDLIAYQAEMKGYNNQLKELQTQKNKLELALEKLKADRNVYTELIDTAKDKYNEGLADFEEATGWDYNDYVEQYGTITSIVDMAPIQPSDMDVTGEVVPTDDPTPKDTTTKTFESLGYGFAIYNGKVYCADQYLNSYWTDVNDYYTSRLRCYQDGVWEEEWSINNTEEPLFPEDDPKYHQSDAWDAAWANHTADDHGADAVKTATGSMKLENYGYCYWDSKNYLAVGLYSSVDTEVKYYRLYIWSDESSSWINVYEGNTPPDIGSDYRTPWNDAWGNRGRTRHGETTLNNGDLTDHDAIIEIVGQLYTASATINNYAGILTNLNQEYDKLKLQVYGAIDYNISLSSIDVTEENEQTYRYSRLVLSDYIDGNDTFAFYFHRTGSTEDKVEYESTVSTKSFEVYRPVNEWYDLVTVTAIPEHYQLFKTGSTDVIALNTPIQIVEQGAETYQLLPDEQWKSEHTGLQESIDKIQEQKDACEKAFYTKYSHYIKEGTWSSNDYVDAELYYLDALQTSANSAMPKVEYSIDVAEVSELEGLENYQFEVGDKTYIEDTEFFGWNAYYVKKDNREITYIAPAPDEFENYEAYVRPAREEVIVSQVEWHLDEPETNVITIQNYKTRFEDLFQRLSATVQTVQYNEATYAKITSLLDADGTINQNVLLASLNGISGSTYTLTSDGSIKITGDEILVQNLTNPSNFVKINSEGIRISSDGQNTWETAIDGNGINAGLVKSGELNTDKIIIGSRENPTFRWDKYGLNAYKQAAENEPYDLNTFVRFDQYGLYGVQKGENYKAHSLAEVKRDAQFGLTWDGFFIKNSYTGGGLVQITSDNDFQVINADQTEKIKIGALEWTNGDTVTTTPIPGVAPSLYGIRINNDAGQTVFKTGDDGNLEITGTIYANAGEIGGMSVDNNRLRMDHIVFEPGTGIYSDWGETSSYPFIISDEDGSATFNNVTVRGAIKTSVFEYEEIQAVGGAFMFRPSTTIKEVEQSGDDLIIKVEKSLILRDGAWYKVSNYNEDTTVDADELSTFGLTHIYQLSKVAVKDNENNITGYTLTLLGAAALLDVVDINDIPGGSIIDMGYESSHSLYNNGKNNYGIGINSSDNYINLPPRAISLFETVVDHTASPKVSYRYRGILGTLPDEHENNLNVRSSIYPYMRGTQGIYTDNMYIGDNNQYIAFYKDGQGDKHLKISAKEMVFEYDPDTGEEITWDDHIDEQIPIRVEIESNIGNMILTVDTSLTLTCTVFKGNEDITNRVTNFTWVKRNRDGSIDSDWIPSSTGRSIVVNASEILAKAIFTCTITI